MNTDTPRTCLCTEGWGNRKFLNPSRAFKSRKIVVSRPLLTQNYITGRTGNEILPRRNAKKWWIAERIERKHLHAPTWLLRTLQRPDYRNVDNKGRYKGPEIFRFIAWLDYAIELNAVVFVKEWKQRLFELCSKKGALSMGRKLFTYIGRQSLF